MLKKILSIVTIFTVIIGLNSINPTISEASKLESFYLEGNVKEVKKAQDFTGEIIEENVKLLSVDMEDIRFYEVQGVYDNEHETYVYDYTIYKTADEQRAVTATPISYNETENTLLIEVGASELIEDLIDYEGATTASTQSKTMYNDYLDTESFSIMSTKSAGYRTRWVDPIRIAVNQVDTKLTFSYNGSKVTSYTASDNRTWLTASGWSEYSHTFAHSYITNGVNAQARTYAHMRNSAFCVGQPTTNVYYDWNNLSAFHDGRTSGHVYTRATGGCSSWLSYSSTLY